MAACDRDEGLLRREVLPDLAEQDVDVLRLDRDDDYAGVADRSRVVGSRLGTVALVQLGDPLLVTCSDDDLEGSRQPELSRPERRASPIRPPPRIAILRELMAEA
jgi:hypothetical protein